MDTDRLQTFEFQVAAPGLRFDQFLALHFPAISLTRIRRAIREGQARVNGKHRIQGWILAPGDLVTLSIDPAAPTSALPEAIPLDILFEDDDLIIINKPTGLLSHPSTNEKSGTLMNALAWHFLHRPHKPGKAAPRPVLLHRLDRDTSGVIAISKNERATRIVTKAFRQRRVSKTYLALVGGVMAEDTGLIDAPIGREAHTWPRWRVMEGGDASQTRFTVKERFASHTLVELEPLTGRTHQLRIHCAHIGHPITGDQVYRGSSEHHAPGIPGLKLKHQLLHAHQLTLRHPSAGTDMTFTAPLPPLMAEAIARLAQRPQES
ncbi:MAG TPA: RluA family pseudouridine synthase [Blastocatellia bacterium]|nr:RluA family pseudouridine synthase [Blastocatellia bacterium]